MRRGQRYALYALGAAAVVAAGVWWWRARERDEEPRVEVVPPATMQTLRYEGPRLSAATALLNF